MITARATWLTIAPWLLSGGCAATAGEPVSSRAPSSGVTAEPALTPIECGEHSLVDVLHHRIGLSLKLEPPSLSGTGEVRLRAPAATATIALDAHDLRISEVANASGSLRFRHAGDELCVALHEPVPAGAELTLELRWQVPTTGAVPRFSGSEVWAGYRASAWMPTRQDPAQRATLALRFSAPAALKVIASGRALAPTPAAGGVVVHAFELERPSPPFLFAFAAGHFEEAELDVDGVKLRAFGPPGADLAGLLAITAPMLRFLVSRTGVAFPASEYTQVFVQGDAAQEAAGFALLSASALDDLRNDPTEDWLFSHELAHQWFAWLVPCADFADFWLNEGFATFLVAAIKEQRWGRAAYAREIGLWRKRSQKVHTDGKDAPVALSAPGAASRPPPRESELQPRGVTYARGALVLDKLRRELGEPAFWDGIRRYTNDRAGKGARSEDLRAALEAASGRDLKAFFATWVYSSAPTL